MTKQELQNHAARMKNIDKLEEELLRIETRAMKMTAEISDEPKGSMIKRDKICEAIIRMDEVKNQINQKLAEAYCFTSALEYSMENLTETEQLLIRLKYMDGKSWEQVAKNMNYSMRHIHRIHGEVLQKLARNDETCNS